MGNKILLTLIVGIFLISFVSASLGTFTQNECVPIRVLANCSEVNITEVTNKAGTFDLNSPMSYLGGQTFNYSFCNTSIVGEYSYSWNNPCVDCSQDNCGNSFEVTASGNLIKSGESGTLIMSIVIMLIIAAFFLIMGLRIENLAGQIILIGTAVILLLATLLFSLVTMTQILGGFSTIIEGYTTFWFIVKIIFGIGITALTVFVLWFSYQAFMIKRGFRD